MYIVGVDLGGTEIKVGLVDREKGIVRKVSRATEVDKGPDKIVENIALAIKEVAGDDDFEYVGIGSPGSIDRKKGIVRFSPNFPDWRDFHLTEKVSELIDKEIIVENDANAFTLGEWYFGKAKGSQNFIALTLGTGIGSGVVANGTFITGNNGIGAELGHIVIVPEGPMCGCGSRGCLESVASAKFVGLHARELAPRYPESLMIKFAGDINKIESKHVFKACEENDELAKIVVNETVEVLARAIGGYVHMFNPEMIIIGGGMSKAGETLFKPLRERTKKYVMVSFRGTYRIEQSDLVENAGILGAASAAIFSKGVE
ncbi:ROK family protein [Oceanotoga sp. DSM 15011]|uniref:Glucokinase n=1 Tax=Oceanotoga teriensis TaxID=515440 RepID=A0AA45C980_9BACT|nr:MULTISPECIES: ROK family protein [Oceanotoga]MDN5343681.1 glucokinase [Oceanotoga sp.]MDO7975287.1 ROK family protein [Oceanotoga teriensis]PWJ96619.1 glucokinase [Oceanotoga teriensis]UYP00209.1 ROK family protein [Oceanotoga sp. DSM 15011]